MIRGFEEQFEKETKNKIRQLLKRINSFSLPAGVSRYYAVDLSLCLQAGALLGALQIASSLLEVFVREIVIELISEAFSDNNKVVGKLQRELEEKKHIDFKKLIKELEKSEVISKDDASIATQFYDDVRIPIHHGLPARFVGKPSEARLFMDSIQGLTHQVTNRELEEVIEENALNLVGVAVGLIERNAR